MGSGVSCLEFFHAATFVGNSERYKKVSEGLAGGNLHLYAGTPSCILGCVYLRCIGHPGFAKFPWTGVVTAFFSVYVFKKLITLMQQ